MSSSPSCSLPSVLINFILHCFISLEQIVNFFRIRISLSNNRLKVNTVKHYFHIITDWLIFLCHWLSSQLNQRKLLGSGWRFIIWSLEITRLTQPISWSPIKKILVIKILIFLACVQVKVKIINFTFLEFSGSGPQSFYQWQSFCERNKTLKTDRENYSMTVYTMF